MAYGLWLMAYGLWLMAYGLWLITNITHMCKNNKLIKYNSTLKNDIYTVIENNDRIIKDICTFWLWIICVSD